MKAAHLVKIEARAKRALGLLLPFETPRGEVADPRERLRDIIRRVDGGNLVTGELRNDIWALTELLETDVPELIEAVREAQGAQRRYCQFCGERRIGLLTASPEDSHVWQCRDADGCEVREERRLARAQEAERDPEPADPDEIPEAGPDVILAAIRKAVSMHEPEDGSLQWYADEHSVDCYAPEFWDIVRKALGQAVR